MLYPAELQADMKIIARFESYCKRFLISKQYQKQYLILFDYATITIYRVLIVALPLYIVVFTELKTPLGGFRYIHLTKGTFILNFDSTLPLFNSKNNSKNNSKLKIFEQKFNRFLGLKI